MKLEKWVRNLNAAIAAVLLNFRPPENLTVSQWAEKHRVLSRETAAEPGPWRNSRTPYLVEPMDAFTDPKVRSIVVVAPSQVGKSELELNILGYVIDQDPGSVLFIHPDLGEARKFARLRLVPLFRDSKTLRARLRDVPATGRTNTVLQKSFPGGMLTLTGSGSESGLASAPCRVVLGDEHDRWELSAGEEGDPWKLAEARQTTFYNAKSVDISSPTVKGRSRIVNAYEKGTQERRCHQCPDCGEWFEIDYDQIKIDHETRMVKGAKHFTIKAVLWVCPGCAVAHDETTMRRQPQKWIADNPDAYEETGCRSFWINGFASPWRSWENIARQALEAGSDPLLLQPFFNTVLGRLWEDRGELPDEAKMLARLEEYDAELPEGVLVLTCGVDTQDNRLEYEVKGWGHFDECWGIKKGIIMGTPDTDEVWQRLDDVIDHTYRFQSGQGLKISVTFVDSGGHYTQEVYRRCRERQHKKVFAIKGGHGDIPLVGAPSQVKVVVNERTIGKCWLYTLGVNAGKAAIMGALQKGDPGPKYMHFPQEDQFDRGYDLDYFRSLLSEKLDKVTTRRGESWQWRKLPGHRANEALDCTNYARAAFKMMNPDTHALEHRMKHPEEAKPRPQQQARRQTRRRRDVYDDW